MLDKRKVAQWSLGVGALVLVSACGGVEEETTPEVGKRESALTRCGAMLPGETLHRGQAAYSCDRRFALAMQTDGNLVLYHHSTAIWQTRTTWKGVYCYTFSIVGRVCLYAQGERAVMQTDGNFVIYGTLYLLDNGRWSPLAYNHPLWSTGTSCPGASLAIQNDGNMVIYHNGVAVWNTGTCCR
jgi:hypothetical protein